MGSIINYNPFSGCATYGTPNMLALSLCSRALAGQVQTWEMGGSGFASGCSVAQRL